MSKPILVVDQVTKSFGGLKAVNNVSFSVRQGEFLGIAGPNGSGKSTLFNILTRIPFGATSGSIIFNDQAIEQMPPHNISKLGLLRTFQKDAEFPDLNAYETVALAGSYGLGLDRSTANKQAEDVLDNIDFDRGRALLKTTELSVYERKQLMIGSALIMKPKILMLDEPASGLTKPEIASLDALLKSINAQGVTVILIEHVLGLLLSVAQRLLVLNHGSLLAEGEPQDVIKQPEVIEAYLGGRTK